MAEIKVEGLRHVYSAGTPFEKVAIEDVSLTIPQGQLVGVIGHTGSGKSTFIQHLNALLQPTEGKVFVGGQDINASKYTRRDVKWQVGLVFQYPEYQLFEETVYRDIAFGPRNMKLSDEEIDQRVREAAKLPSDQPTKRLPGRGVAFRVVLSPQTKSPPPVAVPIDGLADDTESVYSGSRGLI